MAADDEQPEQQERKDRQGAEQAAALDKVTDNVRRPLPHRGSAANPALRLHRCRTRPRHRA